MQIGLNLYSIRNLIQTENEFVETCAKLKEMGYDYIQYSGLPIHVDWIKREMKEVGLPVRLTHVAVDRIIDDLPTVIKEHKAFKCKNIGVGGIFGVYGSDYQEFKNKILELNAQAEKINNAGFKFFYHNHMHEFQRAENGKTWYDFIIENAPYVNFTLDTYWVMRGGVDIYEVIEKLKGRVDCVHFKDHSVIVSSEGPTGHINSECACGDGTLNFAKIFKHVKKAGAKYIIVEQDNAALLPNTLEEVEKSVKYLKNLLK